MTFSGSGPPRRPVSNASRAVSSSAVELEVEDVDVLGDAGALGGLGDDRAALLEPPAQQHLGGALAVRLGNAGDGRVRKDAPAVLAVARVEGDPSDGGPRLAEDVVLVVEVEHGALLEVRVDLQLVDRRDDGGGVKQRGQVVDHEVADTDRPDLTVGQELLLGAVGGEGLVELGRQGLVQEQQVDPVDAELCGALLEAVQGLVVAVVADPDLRLDEDLVARHTGVAQCLADLTFVAIGGGSVDVPVAEVERGLDSGLGLVGRGLEDTEAEGGHLDAVVEGEGLHHRDLS